MRNAILLSGLLVLIGGRPASAQKFLAGFLWILVQLSDPTCPISSALTSIEQPACSIACASTRFAASWAWQPGDEPARAGRYNSPNMQPAIYPERAPRQPPHGASPGEGSLRPAQGKAKNRRRRNLRGEATTSPAAPPTSRSPFPSAFCPRVPMGKLRSRAHPLHKPLHKLIQCFPEQNIPPPGARD